MKNNFVTEWALETIKEKYADDIALAVSHTTLRIDPAGQSFSYFVPITKKGEELARTFILEGAGWDIWSVSWERLERFAELAEYNITCLADAELLYARTPEDARRFQTLKDKLSANLADRTKMRSLALECYAQAKNLYSEMTFATGSDIKLGAGYVLDYLARAIAFTNLTYFKAAQTEQLQELKQMKNVPDGFDRLYMDVILEKEEDVRKQKCRQIICLVQDFLAKVSPCSSDAVVPEHNYQDLADWYGELAYTWLRIKVYAGCQDPVKTYMWGVYLQSELNQVCGDFGLDKMDLLTAYDPDHLEAFAEHALLLENQMRRIITEGGGKIHEYKNTEEFLHEI